MNEKDKRSVIERLDAAEAELYGAYKAIERVRLDLQREWRMLVSRPMAAAGTKEPR